MDNFTDLKITEHKSKINDEIVEDIFKILREENSKSILSKISKKIQIGDIDNLPYQDNFFDVVFCSMEIAGLNPSIKSTFGFCIICKNCLA